MKKDKDPSTDAAKLRRQAEQRLQEQEPSCGRPQPDQDLHRLIHELQVHQVELEMQNAELRQAQEEVRAGLTYADLYDFAPVGYFTLGRDGAIRQVNLTGAHLLETDRAELLTRRFGSFVSVEGHLAFDALLKRVFESRAKESCETTLLLENDRPLHARIEARATEDGQECRMVVVDITDHLLAEEMMLVRAKLESTGILAGGIAHDFNNLLTVIVGNLEVARALTVPGPEIATALGSAEAAAQAARELTQQLITFAKGGVPVKQVISLAGVLQNSVTFTLRGSPVQHEFFFPPDLAPVNADPGQIGQVIRNLVLNAREAMSRGGTVSVRAENVVLSSRSDLALPDGNYVRVSVADQGGGIPKEAIARIFDPYFTTKTGAGRKGMGLGLTVCHSVMRKHGGTIAVAPNAGRGATFHLYFPAAVQAVQEARAPVTSPQVPVRTGRILAMDDEEALRNVTGLLLRRRGYDVELAENGEKAMVLYRAAMEVGRPFDAVILDLVVRGGMGGVQTIKALLMIDPAVKAVVLSGYADDPVLLEFEQYGFKGAIAKPYQIDALYKALDRILAS